VTVLGGLGVGRHQAVAADAGPVRVVEAAGIHADAMRNAFWSRGRGRDDIFV